MNKGVLFFIGLLFGILICGILFYFDIKIFESKFLPQKEKEVISITKTDTVYIETFPIIKKQNIETQIKDTVEENMGANQNVEDISIYETAFSFEKDEQDEIFTDQLLKTRTVKVKLFQKELQEVILPENFFQFFEIQQWNTPIKNKITYNRIQNMIKIKGMEINNMNVVFWNNVYYLEVMNRYYSINETERFEKLNSVIILR
jgi:hypothetical protein